MAQPASAQSPMAAPSSTSRVGLMVWTYEMKYALLKKLYDTSTIGGLRIELGFEPIVWQSASDAVNLVATGPPATPAKCRSKSDTCERDWRAFSMFQGKSGWTYNDKGVPQEPREIISQWFKEHKECRKFQQNGLEFRSWHEEIYKDVIATGEYALPPPGSQQFMSATGNVAESVFGSVELSTPDGNWIRQKEKEEILAASRQRRKPEKVGNVLGAELRALNANVAALVKLTRDPQTEALEIFNIEFARLKFKHKELLMGLFEAPFSCKRFLAASGRWDRIKWIRGRVGTVCGHDDDVDGLREDLDKLAEPFEAADMAERAQEARIVAESRLLGRNNPLWGS